MTNYADDNTPYAMEPNIEGLIGTLQANTSILVNWFHENYFKMNADNAISSSATIVTNYLLILIMKLSEAAKM